MKNNALSIQYVVATFVVLFALFLAPGFASAQTVQNTQCSAPVVTDFWPYIYEGELHSFDYMVLGEKRADVSAYITSVAGETILMRYTTEWDHPSGTRMHVDVPNWAELSGSVSVTVHVKSDVSVSCETLESFSVTLPAANSDSTAYSPSPVVVPPETPVVTQKPVTPEYVEPVVQEPVITEDPDDTGVGEAETPSDEESGWWSGFLGLLSPVRDGGLCSTFSIGVWVFLALFHIALAGAIIFFLRDAISESNTWFAIALLVPFVGFLTIWFFFDGCRDHQWFPVVIALVSLGTVLGIPAADETTPKSPKRNPFEIKNLLENTKNRIRGDKSE